MLTTNYNPAIGVLNLEDISCKNMDLTKGRVCWMGVCLLMTERYCERALFFSR